MTDSEYTPRKAYFPTKENPPGYSITAFTEAMKAFERVLIAAGAEPITLPS